MLAMIIFLTVSSLRSPVVLALLYLENARPTVHSCNAKSILICQENTETQIIGESVRCPSKDHFDIAQAHSAYSSQVGHVS